MTRSRLIVTLSVLLLTVNTQAQTSLKSVDSFAISIGFPDSITIAQITYCLTNKFNDPILKTRAIFAWVANNIAYDCPAYHAESKRKGKPEDVFRLKKAVCEGYANLFMEMCSYAKIQCLVVDGFARTTNIDIGETLSEPNHSWNAVRLNNEWRLIDVTWASGFTDKKVKIFTPSYSDIFFFPDPDYFILSHYPKLSAWKLSRSNLSLKEFFDSPVVLPEYLLFDIKLVSPKKGLIKVKYNQPFTLSFVAKNIENIRSVTVIIGEGKKETIIKPAIDVSGNTISAQLKGDKPGKQPLIVYINKHAVVGPLVKPGRAPEI